MKSLKVVQIFIIFLILSSCNEEPKSHSEPVFSKEGNNTDMLNEGWTENLVVIQGSWTNIRDNSEKIVIKKNQFSWITKDGSVSESWIEAYSNCPNFCSSKNNDVTQYSCFILKADNSADCYTILKLDKEELIFTNISGQPQMHTFKKDPKN